MAYFFSQHKYANEMLEHASMMNYKPATTHADLSAKFDGSGPPVTNPTLYHSLVGALKYLTFTRPDIAYSEIYSWYYTSWLATL